MTEERAVPGALTTLEGIDSDRLGLVGSDPIELSRPVHRLVIQPSDAEKQGLPPDRFGENQIRPAGALVRRLLEMNDAPVTVPRDPVDRVVGTCRHFAVLSCAFLRQQQVAARVRCGFATYFRPGYGLDHWVTEYRTDPDADWVRFDPEILDGPVLAHPERLIAGQFLSGGEAWQAYRRGDIDASRFGVSGTDNWGAAEIRGNAVKDLAALNGIESLPWDEWGLMTDAYAGRTGDDYDALLDELAQVCAADDPATVVALYRHPELQVPDDVLAGWLMI